MSIRTVLTTGLLLAAICLAWAADHFYGKSVQWRNEARQSQQLAKRQKEARNEEQRRSKAINEVSENAKIQLAAARAAANSAQSATDSLHATLKNLQQRLAESESARHTAAATERKARAHTTILLSRLFEESVERNQELAAYADGARERGIACERAYDALSSQSQQRKNR